MYLYEAQISGERLLDHWSLGFFYLFIFFVCKIPAVLFEYFDTAIL